MREQRSTSVTSDAGLVADLRAGDRRAMAELYARHSADAVRVGRIVCRDGDAEDLAAEAFARTFAKIVEGGGPTENFRAYLHTVIRNLNIERSRQTNREHPASDKPWLLDAAADEQSSDVDAVAADHAASALQSLPEKWRQLLWKLEVQGARPAQVAAELDIPVAIISDTAYRAREGLRLAYLNQHLPVTDDRRCGWTRERLARLARGTLSPRASGKARDHLDGCRECATLYDELHRLNTRLGVSMWPIVLVGGLTLEGLRGVGAVGTSGSADTHDTPVSTTSPAGGASPLSRVARAPVGASATVVLAAIVALALAGSWFLRDGRSAEPTAAAPPGSAATQVLPRASDGRVPGADDATPGVKLVADVVPSLRPTPPSAKKPDDRSEPDPQPTGSPSPAAPGSQPDPDPDPGEEPPAQPEPVNLEVGTPTIEETSEPYRWLLTVPILATEGAAADSFVLDLELRTAELTGFIERVSPGWDCGPIEDGGANGDPYFFGGDTPVTCQYTYQPGQSVAPLQLVLESIDAPTGSLSVSGSDNADPNATDDDRTF